MSSIIKGYNYDIFISYRQKDNKHDGWVTKFVENLKGEMESTFKEDVSIYFDENPHDRLQATHNVDKSLEGRLKCLIFIPILSQTYCDPNSYAWQFEFLVFKRFANEDHFGSDVRLRSGNVASRILPIRIHDLEPEDVKLFEKETGSVMRSLDFVFRTASGVNRPLKSNEDHPQDNINKTYYSDQINKVALAIKEVILGMKAELILEIKDKPQVIFESGESIKAVKRNVIIKPALSASNKLLSAIAGISLILIAVIVIYPKIFMHDRFQNIRDADGRISIAVMPFTNLTGDSTLKWFQTGVSSLLINGLGVSSELVVKDDQTMYEALEDEDQVFTAGISPAQAKKVAEKVRAETYISGSFQGTGGIYRILVNLVDIKSGDIIFTTKVEGDLKSSGYLELTDSLCNEIKEYLEIKVLEQKADYDFREAYPISAEGYKYFIEGVNMILSSEYEPAIRSLKKALDVDSSFTFAAFYLAFAHNFYNQFEECRTWTQKAYNTRDRLPSRYQNWLEIWYACFISKNQRDIIQYCSLLEKSGIESRLMWFDLGTTYSNFSELYKKAVESFEKVDMISRKRGIDWKYDRYYIEYCKALLLADMPGEVQRISDKGLKIDPENIWLILYKCSSYVMLGDISAYEKNLSELKSFASRNNIPKSQEERGIGFIYLSAKDTLRAEEHFRIAYNLDPENNGIIYNLTEVLIRSGINIKEGFEFSQKGLMKNPDNKYLLWMNGLALSKLGRQKEALVTLKKVEVSWIGYNNDLQKDIKEVERSLKND